jgi:putative ABC transport system substrate-binding protein
MRDAMKRRDFMTLVGGAALAASAPARAQDSRVRQVGVLMGYAATDSDTQARMTAFKEAFEQLGWKVGRNVQITYRFGGGDIDLLHDYAKELVDLKPDAIVCETTPILRAVADRTTTIPIVFISVTDPVRNKFVADLARPGGNITGFTNFEATMGGKWIELLKKIAPGAKRLGVIFNPDAAPGGGAFFLQSVAASAPAPGRSVGAFAGSQRRGDRAGGWRARAPAGRRPDRDAGCLYRRASPGDHRAGLGQPGADDISVAVRRHRWRAGVIWC